MQQEDLKQKLNSIACPFSETGEGILHTNTLQSLEISKELDRVTCILALPEGASELSFDKVQWLAQEVEKKIGTLMPTAQIYVITTAHKKEALREQAGINGVKNIVVVASGKGGVGKSTIAFNLAIAFKQKGLRVGILDADIYGPSLARLFDIKEKPLSPDGKTMYPVQKEGIATMSMGFVVDEETPVVWRGPMVQAALTQFIKDVWWGELDILVIDTPPGTGDVHLTLAQKVSLSGAVIVTTPQDIALIDARKGIGFFEKVNVPILGLIENMSFFDCPHCHHRTDIFDHGSGKKEASERGIPFLGEIPLMSEIRETSDIGSPLAVYKNDSKVVTLFQIIADRLWNSLEYISSKK